MYFIYTEVVKTVEMLETNIWLLCKQLLNKTLMSFYQKSYPNDYVLTGKRWYLYKQNYILIKRETYIHIFIAIYL